MPADRQRSHTGAGLLLAGIAVLSVVALLGVLRARYDTGESYPNYSSERADPLGTRVLFESLAKLPGVETVRNFSRIGKLRGAPGDAVLLCGLDSRAFASPDFTESLDAGALARFAGAGGRLIIALNPSADSGHLNRAVRGAVDELDEEDKEREKTEKEAREKAEKEEKAEAAKDKDKKEVDEKAKDAPDAKKPEPASTKLKEASKDKDKAAENKKSKRSTATLDYAPLAATLKIAARSREFFYTSKEGSPLQVYPGAPLAEADLPAWYSNVFLDDDPTQDWKADWNELSKEIEKRTEPKKTEADKKPDKKAKLPVEPSPWHTIAVKSNRPMIMERKLGMGSVVVCTDRYFLSNEALWKAPNTKFLSWLFGDASRITFEETHLGRGVGDAEGVMTMARRYRMQGLFLGGILLFGLFIWRSSVSLVPSNANDDLGHWRADAVAGQSTASGLEGLMRRGISPGKLLARCFDVWEGTRAAVGTVPAERRAKARALLESFKGRRQAPRAYREMRDALHPASRTSPPVSPSPTAPP